MLLEKSHEYERRVRSLRKRLTLDFRPLKDTLAKGLQVLIDPEAAVYCTATVEALCDALFNVIIKNLHDEAATGVAPLDTKITVFHIQVALRSHADFAHILTSVESAALVLEYFLDDATSRALYERHLIATRDAKHLRSTNSLASDGHGGFGTTEESEQEMIRMHERTRAEWQKREDDPFSEVDFAMVLKCVHPAFTLSYNATALLSALVRELLNEVCDLAQIDAVQHRVPPELYLDDLSAPLARIFHAGESGTQISRMALDCLERFRLRSRKGTALTIRFRVFPGPNGAAQSHFRVNPQYLLSNVPRDTLFAQLLPQMCKKCHAEAATTAMIYRGHQIELQATTPAALSMPTGAVVYLVSKKWWDYTRRNEARRGLLSSLRPQDAQLKSLVEGTESRVKKDFQLASSPSALASTAIHPHGLQMTSAASPSALALRRDESLEAKRMKQQQPPARSNNANNASSSNSSLHSHNGAPSPSRYGQAKATGQHSRSPVKQQAAAEKERKQQQVYGESDSEDPSQSSAAEDDSLSQLLKQRPSKRTSGVAPPSQQQRPSALSQSSSSGGGGGGGDNNFSEDALSEMQQRHALARSGNNLHASPHHQSIGSNSNSNSSNTKSQSVVTTVQSLAARNAQLMSTLDDAWLGFAAISGGVRSMSDRMATWQRAAEPSDQQQQQQQQQDHGDSQPDALPSHAELAELEDELLGRLERTEALVAQTVAAKELTAQLVETVRLARRSTRRACAGAAGSSHALQTQH